MPLSTDINLPKGHRPVFPNRCIACGSPDPGSVYRVSTHAIGWWTVVFMSWGKRFAVDAPACEACRRRLRRQWWMRLAVNVAFIAAGILAAFYVLHGVQGGWKRPVMVGIVIVSLLPLCLWELLTPRPIDLTAYSETVDYEFRDPAYAAEFAALNRLTEC